MNHLMSYLVGAVIGTLFTSVLVAVHLYSHDAHKTPDLSTCKVNAKIIDQQKPLTGYFCPDGITYFVKDKNK